MCCSRNRAITSSSAASVSSPFGVMRRADIAPVLATTRARDEAGLLEAVEQAGDVGDAAHHALADFVAAEPLLAGAAQDAQHVVLGRGDARGLQHGLEGVFQQGGGALEADEGFFERRLERPGLFEFLSAGQSASDRRVYV